MVVQYFGTPPAPKSILPPTGVEIATLKVALVVPLTMERPEKRERWRKRAEKRRSMAYL